MTRSTFPAAIRRQIFERDGYRCVMPGCPDPTGEHPPVGYRRGLEADHIVARRDGGADTVENGRTLCSYCHERVSNAQKHRWAGAPQVTGKYGAAREAAKDAKGAAGVTQVVLAPAAGLIVTQQTTGRGKPAGPKVLALAPRELAAESLKDPAARVRRHYSEAEWLRRVQAREQYAGDEAC